MTNVPMQPARDAEGLLELIAPILKTVASLDPASRTSPDAVAALEASLREHFPLDDPRMRALETSMLDGVDAGWLCDRGEPQARFCRLAKPTADTHGLSVDVVSLSGRAVEHTHTHGEVTIGVAARDTPPGDIPTFDGRPPGWVFLGPGSRHTPEVLGGRMVLMYFLPDGAVEWHFKK